jgi:plasmid stability protein
LRSTRAPQETFDCLRTLYDIRSKIVHGGRTLRELARKKDRVPTAFMEQAEQICRDVLYAMLKTDERPATQVQALDNTVIHALGPVLRSSLP